MKLIYSLLMTCLLSTVFLTNVNAVVAATGEAGISLSNKAKIKDSFKTMNAKAQRKFKKRLKKAKNKQEKRAAKKAKRAGIDGEIINDSKFRLGVLCFGAGLVLLLLGALFIGFGGFILWVGRIATLVGLILAVWALVEHL